MMAPLAAQPAIPEPPVVFYGQVSPASPAPDLSTVTFSLTGNLETLTTSTPTRVVTIEGTSWYIVSPLRDPHRQWGQASLINNLPSITLTPSSP